MKNRVILKKSPKRAFWTKNLVYKDLEKIWPSVQNHDRNCLKISL